MENPAPQRSVPMRALYIGIGLCALLAVVALASRGDRPSASDGSGDRALPGQFFDYVFTFSIVLALAMVVGLVWLRASTGAQARKVWQVRQMVIFFIAVAGVSLGAVLFAEFLRDNPDTPLGRLLNRDVPTRTDTTGGGAAAREPEFEWSAVIIAGAIFGVTYGIYRVRRRRAASDERTLRGDLAAILDDTLEKLWAEQDPRRAVILAYAWMERTLGAHGLPRVPSEAPLEYLARVLIDLDASRDSVFELTALFERAKFSPHDVDEEMKTEAIAALSAVRDELRGADELAAPGA